VRFSSRDGSPPYLMALGNDAEEEGATTLRCFATALSERRCGPWQDLIRRICANALLKLWEEISDIGVLDGRTTSAGPENARHTQTRPGGSEAAGVTSPGR
jgi:hypothetical protein